MTHYDLKRSCCAIFLMASIVVCGHQSLYAVDRLVPGDFPTIQAAEAASSPGDRIIVSPGTFTTPTGGLVIDVANLQLLSTGGFGSTAIRNNTADEPVIEINAPGVIIGDVGQGFTIEQLTPGPSAVAQNGEVCVLIHGDQVKFANPVRVQYNRLSGNQNDEGILINPFIEAGGLVIQENTFVRNAGTFAFTEAIYFHYADHPSSNLGDVSLFDAAVDILNNDGTEIDRAAVHFREAIYNSRVNINGNQFTFVDNATNEDAIETDDVDGFSTLNITGNTFSNVYTGIYLTDLINGSTCLIQGNTINHYDYGIELYVDYGSSLTLIENTVAGNGTAGYGLYTWVDYGSELVLSGNTISGIDNYGIYNTKNHNGSNLVISDNTVSSATQMDYGISTDTEYGSETTVTGNTVSGWDQYGIYDEYPSETSVYVVSNNTCTADSAGGDYGIYVNDPASAVTATINNNTCSNFDTTGIHISEPDEGATFVCNGNTLTALGAGADYGIYIEDFYNATTVAVDGNTIGGFDIAGIRTGECYNGTRLNLTNNTLTALATGADYGIYNYSVHTGANMIVTGNTVSGYGNSGGGEAGFYQDDGTYDGSVLIFANNAFTAHALGSEHGFFSDYGVDAGSEGHIINNSFTGYTYAGLESNHCGHGSTLTVAGNTFTPRSDASDFGIYLVDGFGGVSQGNISSNTVNGFTDSGIWISDIADGSRVSCNYNEVNGKATSGGHYGINIAGAVQYVLEMQD